MALRADNVLNARFHPLSRSSRIATFGNARAASINNPSVVLMSERWGGQRRDIESPRRERVPKGLELSSLAQFFHAL